MKKLAILSVLVLLGCPKGGDLPSPGPAPGYVPSAEMQKIVESVKPIMDDRLVEFYKDFADVIERDSEIIKTTGHIREGNARAGQLMFQKTGMKGKVPGLAENVDTAIAEAIGKKNVPLDTEKRARAVEVFRALSWACQ